MPTTRGGAVVRNGAHTQGRAGHRSMRKPNRRTTGKPHTRQNESRHPQETIIELPPSPPVVRDVVPRTRNFEEKITCSHFGLSRKDQYPGYHFCENCCFWDVDSTDPYINQSIRRDSQTYRCRANHESWFHPTQLIVWKSKLMWWSSKKSVRGTKRRKIEFDESEDNESDDDSNNEGQKNAGVVVEELRIRGDLMNQRNNKLLHDNTRLTIAVNHKNKQYEEVETDKNNLRMANNELVNANLHLQLQLEEMVNNIEEIKKKLETMERKEQRLEEKEKRLLLDQRILLYEKNKEGTKKTVTTHHDAIIDFKKTINKLIKQRNRNLNNVTNHVVKLLWDETFMEGMIIEKVIDKVREYFRERIFNPMNLLRTMDMNGGQLSMQGIDILRNMETQGEKYNRNSMFPATATIRRTCLTIDKHVKSILPFEEGHLPGGGEYAKFAPKDVVNLMIKGYKLEDESKIRSIKINQAIDGAQLTTRNHHTTIGFKMADRAARDPRTGDLIYASSNETTLQSKHHCFPTMIVMKKETSELYKHFTCVMKEMNELTREDKVSELLGCKPIIAPLDSDMSATWKLCGRGGAMKVDRRPCHICSVHDSELEFANLFQCDRWCKQFSRLPEYKCFHKTFLNEATVQHLRTKYAEISEELCQSYAGTKIIQSKSNFLSSEDPRAVKYAEKQCPDPDSIFFYVEDEDVNNDTLQNYNVKVLSDLAICGLPITGDLNERRERLRQRLIQEYTYTKMHESIRHAEMGSDKSFLLLIDYVPCILHMENRTGLKMLSELLQEGITNAVDNKILVDQGSEKKRILTLLRNIEDHVNNRIFGTPTRPTSFKIPFNMKEKKVEDITLDNNRTRVMILNLHHLINMCVPPGTHRKEQWNDATSSYVVFMNILRKKEDFSDTEVHEFQCSVDDFYQIWMELVGREGITNYFHLLGSGHISDYLFHYRNLYVHSQQGWEAFNSFLKVFFFRRTTRGGGNGDGSKVRQIARWLGRRLLWMGAGTNENIALSMGSNVVLASRKNLGDPDNSSDCSSDDSTCTKSTSNDLNFTNSLFADTILETDVYEDDVHDQSTFLI